ncbi:MAG: hypothetical protein ABSF26_15445 [Thermoguttaceae bacterium]|jgi:hypothetical protein
MKFQRRERILAAATGGLVLLVAVWLLFLAGDSRSAAALVTDRDRLAAEVEKKQKELDLAGRDAKRLAGWQRRSLPAETATARSLYQNWLRGLAARVGFRQLTIESKEVEARRSMFTRLSFILHGRASLSDLTEFLYAFYSAGHLHQIRQLDVKPVERSGALDVNLTVEALALPGADSKDRLSPEPGRGLRLAKPADYRQAIVARNLFAAYSPAPAVAVEKGVDVAEYAFVTAFTESDGARQIWLQDRIKGKTWKLGEGDDFQVGRLHGKVRSIGPSNEVIVDFDGHHRRLRGGENLRGGVEVQE